MHTRTLNLDIETYSDVDLRKCGTYKYTASPNFKILLVAYSYDDEEVQQVDLTKEKFPEQLAKDIVDPKIKKTAYNAPFEMICFTAYLGKYLDPWQWECTSIKCGMLGLPMNLADVSKVLMLTSGKLGTGKALITFFCISCKPTNANGYRNRNLPEHDPVKWAEFCTYNIFDVKAEKEILKKISWFTVPERERELWVLDQKINRLGVAVDIELINSAIKINQEYQEQLIKEAIELTGLQNPKSAAQLKKWLEKETIEADEDELFDSKTSLKAETLPKLIEKFDSEKIKRVLQIRQETSKTSIAKYASMLNAVGFDGRIRGTEQLYGANRTGRWAGRIIQPQNYPKNVIKDLDLARRAVRTGNTELVGVCFDSISYTLSQLLRTCFVAKYQDHNQEFEYIMSDYNQIECRVLAWLANEQWVLDVFNSGGGIYEATAANMLNVPVESIGKKSPERQRGKVATLACGYQGAVGALIKMGALDMGIPENELPRLVMQYRAANPNIVRFWARVQTAAIMAIDTGEVVGLENGKGITFQYKRGALFITLPSGRDLVYCNASYNGNNIQYWGINQTKKIWQKMDTYGGKLVENITQAIARDILREGLLNLDAHGYAVCLHFHDEVLLEVEKNQVPVETINQLLCPQIPWAKGLPLVAEGFKNNYYKKED